MLLSPVVSHKLKMFVARENAEDLELLNGVVEAGNLRTIVDRRNSLAEVADALGDVASGRANGRVVISI